MDRGPSIYSSLRGRRCANTLISMWILESKCLWDMLQALPVFFQLSEFKRHSEDGDKLTLRKLFWNMKKMNSSMKEHRADRNWKWAFELTQREMTKRLSVFVVSKLPGRCFIDRNRLRSESVVLFELAKKPNCPECWFACIWLLDLWWWWEAAAGVSAPCPPVLCC